MNQELAACIRIAISDTINQLRPPVMGVGLPEPIRTALQAHLDSLLKAEREALTQQAGVSDSSEPVPATLWYPDDSGDWVEGHPRDLPPGTPIAGWLCAGEREDKRYTKPQLIFTAEKLVGGRIVAYKVAKP